MDYLAKQITQIYLQQGYITSRAYLTQQDLSDGQLEIAVIEGRLKELELVELTTRELAMVLPQQDGLLNLRHLETALEQLNRLPGYDISMELLPGKEPGQTDITLTNKRTSPYQLQAHADNLGSNSTGNEQLRGQLSLASPFGLADQLTAAINGTQQQGANRGTEGLSLQYRIPYGYWDFSAAFQQFKYRQPVDTGSSEFLSSGRSETYNLKASKIVDRGQRHKWSLHGSITHKDSRAFLDDILLNVSSSKLTVLNIGADYSRQLNAGRLTLNIDAFRGTSLFNAQHDPVGTGPEPAFEKYTLGASILKQSATAIPLLFSSTFYGQYSPDNLFSSEQIAVGGYYNVRGLDSNSFAGIKGWHWRNELAMPLKNVLPENLAPILDTFEPYLGIDTGWAENTDGMNEELIGGVIGFRLNGKHIRFDLGTATGLKGDRQKQSPEVYATLAITF